MTKNIFSFIIFSVFSVATVQIVYEGPDDPASDPSNIRDARMDGNRILLYFKNTTQLSNWEPGGLSDVSIWPNDPTGTRMVDGIGLLIGAKVYIYNDQDSTTLDTLIIDDPLAIANSLFSDPETLHEAYFLQTEYREEVDHNDAGTVNWTLQPVEGYFNPSQNYPAMSDDPNSWPLEGWPYTGSNKQWAGEWDGRFGRGVKYADLEAYFVANDAQDQEYLQNKWVYSGNTMPESCLDPYTNIDSCNVHCDSSCIPTEAFEYYPRPDNFIQESASVQPGLPWGGLGIRVVARAFQWNNPLVRDALFWEYNIFNVSDHDITEVAFGYWVDNAIGGENADDEYGYFETDLDLSYSWDEDGVGFAGSTPGIMGFAFLESPGIAYDNIDNDNDGLLNEERTNEAGQLIGPYDGIYDITRFLEFYGYEESELKEHYEGDEDQDWRPPVFDEQGNCIQVNDDVGLDGVGPNDVNYNEPDADGTECDGRPSTDGLKNSEPNFATTDVSESDMLGLTTFQLFRIDSHTPSSTTKWFKNDDVMWNMMQDTLLMQYNASSSNLVELFASGKFQLSKNQFEHISMAELHSFDNLTGQPGGQSQEATALFELKKTVQLIYESDYRFAQPPLAPTLTAEAGDNKVILTWNNISEFSRDPFLPDSIQYDFEGYKIYRSTDKYLKDAQNITDGFGNPMFYEPLFQCDKIDGITGFSDWAPVFGTSYYLGDDSGIEHKYIDTDVQNGVTYYYAVVAYDYGVAPNSQIESGIPPSENNAIIELDENEYVIGIGQNVAVVTPAAPSAGYIDRSIDVEKNIIGTGNIFVEITAPNAIIDDQEYFITFTNETDNENYITANGLTVHKVLDPPIDLGCTSGNCTNFSGENECADSGCGWSEIQFSDGVFEDILGSGVLFHFLSETSDSLTIYGEWNFPGLVYLTFLNDNSCSKAIFLYGGGGLVEVGTWYSSHIEYRENIDCIGTAAIINDVQFDLTVSDDSTFVFDGDPLSSGQTFFADYLVQSTCTNNSNCEQIYNEQDCVATSMCSWEKQYTSLIYDEKPIEGWVNDFPGKNLIHETVNQANGLTYEYWTLNPDEEITTDVFEGVNIRINGNVDTARVVDKGGEWINEGETNRANIELLFNKQLSKLEPWDYSITWTGDTTTTKTNLTIDTSVIIIDEQMNPTEVIGGNFDFLVMNLFSGDTLDMAVKDMNGNGLYDNVGDKILVGKTQPDTTDNGQDTLEWVHTNFSIIFMEDPSDGVENYPLPGDELLISFERPFWSTDTVQFTTHAPDTVSPSAHNSVMENIKVVPNPYVGTNKMEEAIFNTKYNQRRKLIFTHLPMRCTIHIFTVSGTLVDRIQVNNSIDNGQTEWDLLTNEGLEIAAGMYIYHVRSDIPGLEGQEKMGKFAVIK